MAAEVGGAETGSRSGKVLSTESKGGKCLRGPHSSLQNEAEVPEGDL